MFGLLSTLFGAGSSTPAPATLPADPLAGIHPAATILGLSEAITAAAPKADVAIWEAALTPWLIKAEITTARRVSAFLGQCAVEAGPGFSSLREDLDYTHADRLVAVYHDEFKTDAEAQPYVNDPIKLANRVYANRDGNGDEASGDGARFLGRGLVQITGRGAYEPCSVWCGKSVDDAAAWAETPGGAAASACWYWTANRLNSLADAWSISMITRRVNGPAMEGAAARLSAANAALKAMGGR